MHGSLAWRFIGTSIFTVFAGLSLAACDGNSTTTSTSSGGGGNGGGNGGDGGGTSISNSELYAQAYCDRVFDCCNTADLVEKFGSNTNVVDYAGCRILYRTVWDAAIAPTLADGEKAGRVTFSQTNFETCLKSISAFSCAEFSTAPDICADIFTPKVAVGQACFSSFECIDGKCDFPSGASAGTCLAKPTPAGMGAMCTSNDGCMDGLYCNGSTCETLLADGQACSDNDQCNSHTCVGDSPGMMGKCGTICQGGGPGKGTIDKTLESLGGELATTECNKYFDCCSGDEFDTVLFPGMRTKAQCLSLYGIFGGIGLVEIHNDAAQNKISLDGASLQACLDNFAALSCADFSKSSSFPCLDGIKGLVADGGSCTDDRQCTNKYCNLSMGNPGTCATIPGVGAPCTNKCADGFYCNAGTCTAQKPVGMSCSSTNECAEGRCYGPNGMKTCALICDGI